MNPATDSMSDFSVTTVGRTTRGTGRTDPPPWPPWRTPAEEAAAAAAAPRGGPPDRSEADIMAERAGDDGGVAHVMPFVWDRELRRRGEGGDGRPKEECNPATASGFLLSTAWSSLVWLLAMSLYLILLKSDRGNGVCPRGSSCRSFRFSPLSSAFSPSLCISLCLS